MTRFVFDESVHPSVYRILQSPSYRSLIKSTIESLYPDDAPFASSYYFTQSDEIPDEEEGALLIGQSEIDAILEEIMEQFLQTKQYVRLGVGSHGIGVFAIRDIPNRTYIFDYLQGRCLDDPLVVLSREKAERLPAGVQALLNDFYLSESGDYPIPLQGPNAQDTSYYLNHSERPNVEILEDKTCKQMVYRTARKVREGEELTIDYRTFGIPREKLIRQMPFLR